jgi:hypothetical protein
LSFHRGPYNVWEIEGLTIDQKRGLTIWALDWDLSWRGFELVGEYAGAAIEVPEESGIYQDSQQGIYAQLNAHFGRGWVKAMPASVFTGVVRLEGVDFDTQVQGDSQRRLTLGLNFRPEEDTAFKLDYQRQGTFDAFNNEVKGAALLFSAATYF